MACAVIIQLCPVHHIKIKIKCSMVLISVDKRYFTTLCKSNDIRRSMPPLPHDLLFATIAEHTLLALVATLLLRTTTLALLQHLPLAARRQAASSAADLAFHVWLCLSILRAQHVDLWPHTPGHYVPASAPDAVRLHVAVLGFYFAQMLLLITDGTSKRRAEFAAHHALASALVVLALFRGRTAAGLLVMLLHSVFDPVFQAARMLHVACKERAAHRVLGVALYVFVATRLVGLPALVGVYALYDMPCAVVLSALIVLHVYWARALAGVYRQFSRAGDEIHAEAEPDAKGKEE